MSIRFRVTVAPSGKKYGAIVNTFRDKATGKVKTQGLKSYGVLSDQKLKDEAFLQAVDADVKAIKDQFLKQTAVMREIHSKLDDDSSLSKTSSFAMPQYYYALALYRKFWEILGCDAVFSKLGRKSNDPAFKIHGDLICFYFAALLNFNPASSFDTPEDFAEHIFDLSFVNEGSYKAAIKLFYKNKDKIIDALNEKRSFAQDPAQNYTFYLTKFYFLEEDKSKGSNLKEVPMLFSQFLNSFKIPIDFNLWEQPKNRAELYDLLQRFEQKYSFLKESGGTATVISDTELNNKRSLLSLSELGYNYILIRNLHKFPRRMQDLILSNGKWMSVYNKQGQSVYKYKEFILNLSGRSVLGKTEPYKVKSRFIVIWSDSKRIHDLDRLAKQWEAAYEVVSKKENLYEAVPFDENEENTHGLMQFIRKKEDISEYELDFSAYRNRGVTAGFYIIATSLGDPVHDLYRQIRTLWRDKEIFRAVNGSNEASSYKFIKDIQGQFVLKHIAFVLERCMLYFLKRNGLNVSAKQLREIMHESMLAKMPENFAHDKILLKTCNAESFNKTLRKGRKLRFDEVSSILGLTPLQSVETLAALKNKLTTVLPFIEL